MAAHEYLQNAMASRAVITAIVVALACCMACQHPHNPAVRQLPSEEAGYFGQPGNFYFQVDTGGSDYVRAWMDANDRMTIGYESSKGSIQKEWVEQSQRSVVVLPLVVDSLTGFLIFNLESFVGEDGIPSTHTTFEFDNISGLPLATIPLTRYQLCSYCKYYYGKIAPLNPDSPRLQTWTQQNGTPLQNVLIGPDTNRAYSTIGSYTIRASQVGYAQNIGWLGATVTIRGMNGFSKTLTLRRILPKD